MAQTAQGAIKVSAIKRGMTVDEYLIKIKTLKWCTKCKAWQPRKMFNVDNSRGDRLTAKCHACTRVNRPHKSHKGRISTFKGRRHTLETRAILSKKLTGRKSAMAGKKLSIEMRIKISNAVRAISPKGVNCHSYKDGKALERHGIRCCIEYKRWRFDVFARDKFTCQKCGDNRGGNLNAHHIKPFADFPELRFDINNGITYCEPCHKMEHAKVA